MNIYNYYRSMNSPDLWNTFQATKDLIANSNALIDLPDKNNNDTSKIDILKQSLLSTNQVNKSSLKTIDIGKSSELSLYEMHFKETYNQTLYCSTLEQMTGSSSFMSRYYSSIASLGMFMNVGI